MNVSTALFVAKGLAVGSNHTFTVTTVGPVHQNPIAVFCASGSTITAGGADASSAFNNTAGAASTIQAGNVTNSNTLQIDIAVLGNGDAFTINSIGSGFTIVENVASANSITQGLGLAYKLEPAATTENPLWTLSNTSGQWDLQAQNATFKSH